MKLLISVILILTIMSTAGEVFCAATEADTLATAIRTRDMIKIMKIVDKGPYHKDYYYIDTLDKDGWTALMYTAMYGYVDIAKILLDRKANVNEREWLGWTPLMLAEYFGKTEVALLFIEKGADVNAKSNAGWTPLMYAALYNRIEIGKALIKKGAVVNAKSSKGETALSIAQEEGRTQFAELLKQAGAK
jgi:uncharacterized protein